MIGPFPVTCVLAAAVPAAAFSTSCVSAHDRRRRAPSAGASSLGRCGIAADRIALAADDRAAAAARPA